MNEHLISQTTAQHPGSQPGNGILKNGSRLATIVLASIAVAVVLIQVKEIIAPVTLAIVVGLMFGPLQDWLEGQRIPSALSAALVVLVFIGIIGICLYFFVGPVTEWIARGPEIWERLRTQLTTLKEPLASLSAFQEELRTIGGEDDGTVAVTLNDGAGLMDWAMHAPSMGAEILVFLVGLYFYAATRREIRHAVLSLVHDTRLRWRMAHVFQEIERKISNFLVTVTLLNIGVGIVTAAAMLLVGLPSPLLWGALAFGLNYIPYVGQGVMLVLLLVAGVGTQDGIVQVLLPSAAYLIITFAEGQIITPHVLGHRMTINPFVIFLSTALGLWAWGPIGGAISVPMLLICQTVLAHARPRPDREVHDIQKRLTAAVFKRTNAEAEGAATVDTGGTALPKS